MQFSTALIAIALAGLVAGCAENTAPTNPLETAHAPSLSLVGGNNVAGPLYTMAGASLCMDVKGISTTPGALIQVYTCKTGQKNQQFLWMSDSTLRAYSGGTLCVADDAGRGQDGDRIVIATCNASASQKWGATAGGQIRGINGKCLAVPGSSSGTWLVLATCASGTSQQWDRSASGSTPAPPTPPAPPSGSPSGFKAIAAGIRPRGYGQGTYALVSPTGTGRSLFVDPAGNDGNAGSSTAPFKTIAKAAQLARAGDVVTIRNGTYTGSVKVSNSGSSSAPIVFQAAQRGGVVLTDGNATFGPVSWTGGTAETGQLYVTVRGLIFRRYAANAVANPGPSFPAALRAARGWRVEDCLFDDAGNTAVMVEGSYVAVVRTTIQNTYFEALAAWAHSSATSTSDPAYTPLDGIQLVDLVLKGNYALNQKPTSGGVADYSSKFLVTRGTLLDNVEAANNNGPGFWFDTQNSNFTVRNSYFHNNKNITGTTSTGRGLNLEANFGPALIENNVFEGNGSMGLEVTATAGVTIRANLFINNPRCIELTSDLPRAGTFPLKNIAINSNQCGNYSNFSGIQTIGGSTAFTTPALMNIKADSNVYQPAAGSNSYLAWWENKTIGVAATISDFRTKWGWEAHGSVGTITWP